MSPGWWIQSGGFSQHTAPYQILEIRGSACGDDDEMSLEYRRLFRFLRFEMTAYICRRPFRSEGK
jgi:hypothetical protein